MNILDAIKSGRRFKRENWLRWFDTDEIENGDCYPDVASLIADDWIIEPESKKKRMYQVIVRDHKGNPSLSRDLFHNEDSAKNSYQDIFIALGPAIEWEQEE